MSFLDKINQVSSAEVENKPKIKLQELPVGEKFHIVSLRVIKHPTYGETILVELDEKVTFLPKRVTNIYKEHLSSLQSGEFCLVFKGLQQLNGVPHPRTLFEIVEQ